MNVQGDWDARSSVIAGSTHLFGKRRNLYCNAWPASYRSARGCYIHTKKTDAILILR